MNIFAFDEDPWVSALWLDDVRKNKMILEAAQMLSTAVRFNDPFTTLPVYKSSYVNHPCTKWVRQSKDNFGWCLEWMKSLGKQKGSPHKSMSLVPLFEHYYDEGKFKAVEQTPFANCARNLSRGVDFSGEPDTCLAYRKYICERWKENNIKLTWTNGEKPTWLT